MPSTPPLPSLRIFRSPALDNREFELNEKIVAEAVVVTQQQEAATQLQATTGKFVNCTS